MVAHRIKGKKLGRKKDQRRSLLRSLVRELVVHERISTTEAKGKEARRFAERLISYGKVGDLHNRRLALSALPDEVVVRKIFTDLAPRYATRPGGYVRLIKLEPRKGDAAKMTLLELVE